MPRPPGAEQLGVAHLVMVLAGLVTFVAVASVLRDRGQMSEVLVARTELPIGTVVSSERADSFAVVAVRSDLVMLDELVSAESVPNGQLVRSVAPGEPILASDIEPLAAGRAARTLTIPLDDTVLIGLGLEIGDRVDVIGLGPDDQLGFVVTDAMVSRLPSAGGAGGAFAPSIRDAYLTIEVGENDALLLAGALRNGGVDVVRATGAEPHSNSTYEPGRP